MNNNRQGHQARQASRTFTTKAPSHQGLGHDRIVRQFGSCPKPGRGNRQEHQARQGSECRPHFWLL